MKKQAVFLVWFVIFLAWAVYRAYFNLPEWIDEFVVKPVIFAFPIFYLVLIREKGDLSDLGLKPSAKEFMTDLYFGVFLGALFALEGLGANYLKYGNFSFSPSQALKVTSGVGVFFLLNLVTSVWEEILGRGYLYLRLFKITNNQFSASVTSSFLFLLLHIPIMFTRLHLTGSSLIIYAISILLLGITNCYLLTLRGSLTLPILLHAFWNMTVALFL